MSLAVKRCSENFSELCEDREPVRMRVCEAKGGDWDRMDAEAVLRQEDAP